MTTRKLFVHSVLPVPNSRQKSGTLDDRLYWLTWSLKRGESWRNFDGQFVDPAAKFASLADDSFSLAADRILVPTPRSDPSVAVNDWPSYKLAIGLHARGFGSKVMLLLARTKEVGRSSSGAARPSVRQHIASMSCSSLLHPSTKVTIVDDTLIKGTQLVAAGETIGVDDVCGFTGSYGYTDGEDHSSQNLFSYVEWNGGDYPTISRVPPLP